MFVQDETSHNSLNRPQLKWLLVVLLALMVGVVVWVVVAFKNRRADNDVMMYGKKIEAQKEGGHLSSEEIQKQLEQLESVDSNGDASASPSAEKIDKQLEVLEKTGQTSKQPALTSEEIRSQLEMLQK